MSIFTLTREGRIDYDETGSAVVVARDEVEARKIMATTRWGETSGGYGDEGPDVWLSPTVSCVEIGTATSQVVAPKIVCCVHRNG